MLAAWTLVTLCAQFGVETAPDLLDKGKVKARCVGDCLNEVRIAAVSVSPGSRRMLPDGQSGDGLSRGVAEVRLLSTAAVTRPPDRIDRKLHQVGEPSE